MSKEITKDKSNELVVPDGDFYTLNLGPTYPATHGVFLPYQQYGMAHDRRKASRDRNPKKS
jgi:hypothetical protein